MSSTLGISPLLKPSSTNNSKWLQKEPLQLLDDDNLEKCYQELVDDKEIYNPPETYLNCNGDRCHRSSNGNYYCGQVVLECSCCNGVCGPAHGCSCKACLKLTDDLQNAESNKWIGGIKTSAAEDYLEAWTWGAMPTLNQLKSFSKLTAHRQLTLMKKAMESDLFLKKVKSRVFVYARILSVYSKTCFTKESNDKNTSPDKLEDEKNVKDVFNDSMSRIESEKDFLQSSITLTLKFTFKCIRNILLDGKNVALCSELLQETVDMFSNIHRMCLLKENNTSPLLHDMIGETFNFFYNIISSNDLQKKLDIHDKKNVLLILLEMAFQYGSLPLLLKASLLCMNLKEDGVLNYLPAAKFVKKLSSYYFENGYVPEIVNFHLEEKESTVLPLELQDYINTLDEDCEIEIESLIAIFLKIIMCISEPYHQPIEKQRTSVQDEDVLVWGSLKYLSSLKDEHTGMKVATICCSEQLLIILTLHGKMLRGKADDKKLDIKPYEEVADLNIIDVTCSFTGYFIGLSKYNKILTWFDDNETFSCLSNIPLNITGEIHRIYAGYNNYAVLTSTAEFCLWDQRMTGRAVNDVGNMQLYPRKFEELKDFKIVDVAFSHYHSEVLVLTNHGKIWLFENNSLKLLVEEDIEITRVCIAKYFYVALSSNGQVWRWGKDQFNKASSSDIVYMQSVEKLNKENVLTISVGGFHCIALTKSNNVFCWGGLGGKEEDESLIHEPVLLQKASDLGISKLVAGPRQIFCWSVSSRKSLEEEIPFCVNITKVTFERLYCLITKFIDGKRENENLSSYLSLLLLQFQAARKCRKTLEDIFSDKKDDLLCKLKDVVMLLIVSENDQICKLAEKILSCGWIYLLPTAEDRAKTLSDLLVKCSEQKLGNQAFIMKLLLTCLLEERGLEELIEATFTICDDSINNPRPAETQSVLLKELFLATTKDLFDKLSSLSSSLFQETVLMDILLKYQRLLFARVFLVTEKDVCWPARCYVFDLSPLMKILLTMLNGYIGLLLSCCKQVLSCQATNKFHATAILSSPVGVLFHEFIVYMIILQNFAPVLAINCDCIPQLAEMLDLLDTFNKTLVTQVTSGEDNDCANSNIVPEEKCESDCNKSCDSSSSLSTIGALEQFAGNEVSTALANAFSCNQSKELVRETLFGNRKKVVSYSIRDLKRILVENECMLSFFLGLHCCYLAHGMYPSHDEVNHKKLIQSQLFKGGIVKQMVLKDRNAIPPASPIIADLITEMPSHKSRMLLKYFYIQAEKEGMMIVPHFEKADEKLEKCMYFLLAALLLHTGLVEDVSRLQTSILSFGENVKQNLHSVPMKRPFKELLKSLLNIRMDILKKHQETGDSYEDLCEVVISNATFLCIYLVPTISYQSVKQNWITVADKLVGKKTKKKYVCACRKELKEYYEKQAVIIKEIHEFVVDDSINLDILRKCFLMQVKRAKQRLISGYLMQSLTLRQSLYLKVQFSLQLGWLGLLVPGGGVSGAKPGIMHNVELIPKDDVVRMHEVFKGVETFALKEFFDRCDTIKKLVDDKGGANAYMKRSGKYLLMYITLFGSSLISGDVDFLVQCGVLEKIQYLLKLVTTHTSTKSQVPFIDPIQMRQTDLEELSGPLKAKVMKIGTRVVRGADWKWDDQDGPSPGRGRIVSELGDDGWIRVEWDTGFRNSYRMGKSGKFDLQIIDDEFDVFHSTAVDRNDTSLASDENDLNALMSEYVSGSLTVLTFNLLSSISTNDVMISEFALNHITKFFIQIYKDLLNCSQNKWSNVIFGFLRSLSVSPLICEQISCNDWIDLIMKLFDLALLKHNEYAGAEALLVKVQLIRQLQFMVKIKDMNFAEGQWKTTFVKNLFKSIEKLLKLSSLFLTNEVCSSPIKSSLTASVHLTVIEELIQLLRYLSSLTFFKDIIRIELMQRVKLFQQDIMSQEINTREYIGCVAGLCVIAGLDNRVRIGSCVNHESYGRGVVKLIKPNGKVVVNFNEYMIINREASLNSLEIVAEYNFDLSLLDIFKNKIMEINENIFKFLIVFPRQFHNIAASTCGVTQRQVTLMKLYISSKRYVAKLMQDKTKVVKLCTSLLKLSQSSFLPSILEKSFEASDIQSGYNKSDYEIAALSLVQYICSGVKRKSKPSVLSEKQSSSKREENVSLRKHENDDSSNHLFQLLSAMGFPQNYIEHALEALGERTRPEQIVSWLLEHPDEKSIDIEKNSGDNERAIDEDEEDECEDSDDDDDDSDTPNIEVEKVSVMGDLCVGCVVESVEYVQESLTPSDTGVLLKFLYQDKSGLVYWPRLNFSVWVLLEKLRRISPPASALQFSLGSFVHLKNASHSLSTEDVGIVISTNPEEDSCDLYFEKNIFVKEKCSQLSHIERDSFCGSCRKKKCAPLKRCQVNDECYLCDVCEEPCLHQVSLSPTAQVNKRRHDDIKYLKVSSNQQLARGMLNNETDVSWIPSDTDKEPWLLLHMRKNVLICQLSLLCDVTSHGEFSYEVYCKKSNGKYELVDRVTSRESKVKLLAHQDEIFSQVKVYIRRENNCDDVIKINQLHISCLRREPNYDEQIFALFKIVARNPLPIANDLPSCDEYLKCRSSNKQICVFCWGLNDKHQLAGLKGSKIKSAVVSEKLSKLQCKDFVGGSKTLFCISNDNFVYACGEATNGRLGLGDHMTESTNSRPGLGVAESTNGSLGFGDHVIGNVILPTRIEELKDIKKLAVHPGGRHTLALSFHGHVYSWGEGDDGKLGHGNTQSYNKPKLIESLRGKFVTDIACGGSHSAAIVDQTHLYTWGLGDYGRLGHGDELSQLEPKLVASLSEHKVINVACGSRDAQTVCITDDGNVWSWGDGDFGKLGRGGSDGCLLPMVIEKLRNKGIVKVLCGAQFTLALSNTGVVWTWGKGDFFRLGHGNDNHVREPIVVRAFQGKNIIDVAVGALHCLAVTEEGEIYAWGDNDHGQQGTGTVIANKLPTRVLGTEDYRIKKVACGSSHSLAWAQVNPTTSILEKPLEFSNNRDPLGYNTIKCIDAENESNVEKFLKDHKPSLTCSVLELSSKKKREEALLMILATIDIEVSRDLLLALIACTVDEDKMFGKLLNSVSDLQYFVDVIIRLLKIMSFRKCNEKDMGMISKFLKKVSLQNEQVSTQIFHVCVKELELKIAEDSFLEKRYKPSVHETSHPYIGLLGGKLTGSVKYPGALSLTVIFDDLCQTEVGEDVLLFYDGMGRNVARRHGHLASDWSKTLTISGDELSWTFITNSPGGLWGFRFTVTPSPPTDQWDIESMSDSSLLQEPSLLLVKRLLGLECVMSGVRNEESILKLACLLAMCIQTKLTDRNDKTWMIDELHSLMLSHNAPPIDVPMILNCSRQPNESSVCKMRVDGSRNIKQLVLTSSLADFINGIPPALLKQYDYEEVRVRQIEQLQFTPFLRSLALLGCSLGLDTLPPCSNKQHWAWFQRYCTAIRTAQSFMQNTQLPKEFTSNVRERIRSTLQDDEDFTHDYEQHELFDRMKDEQLLNWLNRRTHDWSVVWGGSGTIYAWGHNHRGQLAGIEGAKVKSPTVCNSLAALKPVQIAGGEQTLFCVTPDGKVYATGYGSSARLGLGIQESISTPRMIESIQHITIKKVAVHSGGRHCLALSNDGEVYSWGEGDDGKLGHGNRFSCSTPKLIESLRGINVVDIACGGSHSAAIGERGELYTWGKGRYGRLGHGDGEDQLRPKFVEHLQNHHVIDVACGSGDAQTLCITDDDRVWSWGDGDYGKLGRGGSDGCKIPLVIDYLTCKGIVKVECGSQFSLALTSYGIVYAWGKGDYFRLGLGTETHIRYPRNIVALENKHIVDIACGSLHCVVVTDEGDVYCWGDNDEGQLGDGTTNPGNMPKLCTTLQSKKIDRIACGSAHTIAWSTCAQNQSSLPDKIPLEYNHLQDISIATLRNRAIMQHTFSKLFSSCIPLLNLISEGSAVCGSLHDGQLVNSLKGSILSHFKETFFRKVIDATMIRDRQHGPIVEINRVTKHRGESRGNHLKNDSKSVFGQLTKNLRGFPTDNFLLPQRHWKVKFLGESVDDCGGGFSESIAEMCEELQNGTLPLLITTSCRRDDDIHESFIFNPEATSSKYKDMYHFFGLLLGIAVRSGNPLSLALAEPMWQLLVGSELSLTDLGDVDSGFVTKIAFLNSFDQQSPETDTPNISDLELPFTVRSACGNEIRLSQKYEQVTSCNRQEYIKKAVEYKLHEFDKQVAWIRSGMAQTIPVPLLSLFTGAEFENMICGNPDIPVESFKSITTYRGIEPLSPLVQWFWQTLEEFSNYERSLFLRFVWGRTRLPRTALDFKGKDFILQVLDKYNPPDTYLPESYTCFFLLKLPRYSSFEVLRDKLKYAIYFCKSIDSDDYARID